MTFVTAGFLSAFSSVVRLKMALPSVVAMVVVAPGGGHADVRVRGGVVGDEDAVGRDRPVLQGFDRQAGLAGRGGRAAGDSTAQNDARRRRRTWGESSALGWVFAIPRQMMERSGSYPNYLIPRPKANWFGGMYRGSRLGQESGAVRTCRTIPAHTTGSAGPARPANREQALGGRETAGGASVIPDAGLR